MMNYDGAARAVINDLLSRQLYPSARAAPIDHSSLTYMYNNKTFRLVSNTPNGEASGETIFHYQQQDNIVWADYAGGSIVKGFLIATVQDDDTLDMRYQHVNTDGKLMTGRCHSTPEQLPDGRIRLHERWQWTNSESSPGESTLGESVVDEVPGY